MYAIVSIGGQQLKVEKGNKVFVHRLPGEVGSSVSFDKVLLISNQDKVSIGEPYLDKAIVLAQILSHLRGDKIQVFKKKRRKGYKVFKGHRQHFTEILIEDISESGLVKKAVREKTAGTKQEVLQPVAADVKTKDRKMGAVETKAVPTKPKTVKKVVKKEVVQPSSTDQADKTKETGRTTKTTKSKATEAKATASKKTASKTTTSKTASKKTAGAKTDAAKTAAAKSKPVASKAQIKKKSVPEKKPDKK